MRSLEPNLTSILTFFNEDDRIKVILFVYLFQINDWFGASKVFNDSPGGYLSHCSTYKNKIQGFLHEQTELFSLLNTLITALEGPIMIIDLFKRMVPHHQLELMCLVLLALPAQLIANLNESAPESESRLWSTI